MNIIITCMNLNLLIVSLILFNWDLNRQGIKHLSCLSVNYEKYFMHVVKKTKNC